MSRVGGAPDLVKRYFEADAERDIDAIVELFAGDATVFDSNAILLYLAEKTGKFLPDNTPAARGQLYSWLMFVGTGIGPYSGQAVHFKHHAPEQLPYAINRYAFEAKRHYAILDVQLAKHRYMLGDTYTIVDMAAWGWARLVPFVLGDGALTQLPNVILTPHIGWPTDEAYARFADAACEALLAFADGREFSRFET